MKTIVILGASDKPHRASNTLLTRLQHRGGYAPVPVHPAIEVISGIPVQKNLSEVTRGPEVLSMYLSADRSSSLEADIIALKPHRVIFNPGAENPQLELRLIEAGITTENSCSLVLLSQNLL
jgi:predicted CoA-binding protein